MGGSPQSLDGEEISRVPEGSSSVMVLCKEPIGRFLRKLNLLQKVMKAVRRPSSPGK